MGRKYTIVPTLISPTHLAVRATVTPHGTVNDQSGQAKRAKLYTWNADGAVLSIEQLNGSQAVSIDSFTYDSQRDFDTVGLTRA